METKKIPAFIDDKDVMTDWIEEIFDHWDCTYSSCQLVGFVNDVPTYAHWNGNTITWKPMCYDNETTKETLDIIKKKLLEYETDTDELYSEIYIFNNASIIQKFYFKS